MSFNALDEVHVTVSPLIMQQYLEKRIQRLAGDIMLTRFGSVSSLTRQTTHSDALMILQCLLQKHYPYEACAFCEAVA